MTFKSAISMAATAFILSLPGLATAQDAPDANTVVATVNGTEITLGHMLVLRQRLPQQYQQLPPEVLFNGILDQLVQQTLLGEQVETLSTTSQKILDNENRALKAAEELRRAVDAAMTDEAIQAAYDETYGNAEPETEYNASHILFTQEEGVEEGAALAEAEQAIAAASWAGSAPAPWSPPSKRPSSPSKSARFRSRSKPSSAGMSSS